MLHVDCPHSVAQLRDVTARILLLCVTQHISGNFSHRSVHSHLSSLDGPGMESPWEGAKFSAPIQTGPGAHPAFYTMRTGSFLGVKRPGRGIDHPPLSSAEVEGRVELYIYSP